MNNIGKSRVDEILSLHGEIEGLFKLSLDKAILIGELLECDSCKQTTRTTLEILSKAAGREQLKQHGTFSPGMGSGLRRAKNEARLIGNE